MSERRDSNPEPPAPKAGALAVRPRSETLTYYTIQKNI